MYLRYLKIEILQFPECSGDRSLVPYQVWSKSWPNSVLHTFLSFWLVLWLEHELILSRLVLYHLNKTPWLVGGHPKIFVLISTYGIQMWFHSMPGDVPMKTWNPQFFCCRILIIVDMPIGCILRTWCMVPEIGRTESYQTSMMTWRTTKYPRVKDVCMGFMPSIEFLLVFKK
jgi:hypothetical protein